MRLKDIGEDGFLNLLRPKLPLIGDDCAILRSISGSILYSADMLVEGTHFLIPPFRYRWIGSKSVLSNISDVVAMGGCPRYVTVSLGVDPETEVKDLDDFFLGLY